MALQIERILESRFEFSLDGGDPISDNAPNLTTFGNICHFKTRNGANIIANQNVTYADVTVVDTFGGSGTFSSFPNVQALWVKLIELQFFDGLASGGGGGATRFDALTDAFTYFGNDGKVPVVDESQLELVATTFYNFNEFIQLEDVSISTLVDGKILGVALVGGTPKIVLTDPTEPSAEYFSAVGGFYYADLTTQTTPLAYTTGDLQLENDIEGNDTFLTQPPYGITSVWDESSNTFDFSQLSIGDEVFIRVDLIVDASGIMQSSKLKLLLGEGTADEKTIIVSDFYAETTGAISVSGEINFQLNNENWRTTAAKLLFSADAAADIEVTGWHVYIIRKSVNILDISDDTFKTFSVAQLANPTVDTSTNVGTLKIGYEGTNNKVTNILFDIAFSKYLVGFESVSSTKNLEVVIYNKTKGKLLTSQITGFTEPSTGYYNITLANSASVGIAIADVAVNDSLDVNISVSLQASAGISNVVEDTTPQLGGSLDTNSKSIEWSKGADVASATELLLLRDGNYFDVTGTTTIATIEDTADAWKVGSIAILQFDDVLTLTHSANLILPTGSDITTAAGDIAFMQKVASGDWKCVSYQRADGTPLVGGGSGSFEYQTEITTNTTLDGTQKGEWKVYPVNSTTAKTITVTTGDYSANDIINIERRGQGSVEIIADTGVRIRGVRNSENRYFINDVNSIVSILARGSEEFGIIGNLTRGYTGAVTTASYGTLREGDTAVDVTVIGTGFSSNMLVTVSSNATQSSAFTYVSPTEITLHLTAVGSETDTVTVTYDNGDVFVDTDAITIAAASSIPLGNLVSYWKFNNNSTDSQGSNNATLGGTAAYTTGLIDNCLDVVGAYNSYAVVSDDDTLSFAGVPFSYQVLIRLDSLAATSTFVVKRNTPSSTSAEYQFNITTGGEIIANLFDDGTANIKSATTTDASLVIDTWYLITITDDGTSNFSGLNINVDAVDKTLSDSSTGSYVAMSNTGANVKFGALWSDSEAATNAMNGKINMVSVWNKALNNTEITAIKAEIDLGNHLI